nr:protein PAIR1-like isoform X2 [Quercus suber]
MQRFGSQEPENFVKKIACLPPPSCTREESQMQISRSSANLIRKWNSASVTDHRCQISEELEHRIGLMETLLSRFGMILDSVQSNVMQVNKGTKEVSLEMDSIRQKLTVQDNFLQSMVRPSDVMFEIRFLLTRLRYGKPVQRTRRFES